MGAIKWVLFLWAMILGMILAVLAMGSQTQIHKQAAATTKALKAESSKRQNDVDAVFGVLDGGNVQ